MRTAIVNTARQDALKSCLDAWPVSDVDIVGAGLENLRGAEFLVTMEAKARATGPQQAVLEVGAGGATVGHAVLFTLMK